MDTVINNETQAERAEHTITRDSAFGSHYRMYRMPFAAYAYTMHGRSWEAFACAEDGAIQDILGNYVSKAEARCAAFNHSARAAIAKAESRA